MLKPCRISYSQILESSDRHPDRIYGTRLDGSVAAAHPEPSNVRFPGSTNGGYSVRALPGEIGGHKHCIHIGKLDSQTARHAPARSHPAAIRILHGAIDRTSSTYPGIAHLPASAPPRNNPLRCTRPDAVQHSRLKLLPKSAHRGISPDRGFPTLISWE